MPDCSACPRRLSRYQQTRLLPDFETEEHDRGRLCNDHQRGKCSRSQYGIKRHDPCSRTGRRERATDLFSG